MNITLVFPPITLQERYGENVGDIRSIGGHLPPLGLGYIAAVLEKSGYNVNIIDATVLNLPPNSTVSYIKKTQPDLIGVTALTPTFYRSVETCRLIKDNFPDVPLVVGGPHVSIFSTKTLNDHPFIDFAVTGEGEYPVLELVKVLESNQGDFSKVAGLTWRNSDKIIENPKKIIENLDAIPFPARHLLPIKKYRPLPNSYKRLPQLTMLASRGCPYSCTFCSKAVSGRIYRVRSVDNIIDEIKFLIDKYKVKEIAFWDDIFTVNRKWAMDISNQIIQEGLDLTWTCETRVNLVDKELLQTMAKAGCWNIFYGIESGVQKLLDRIDKHIKIEQIREAVKLAHEAGIEIRGSFMLALPGETPEMARKTIQFAIDLDVDYAQFSPTTPFPGTKLYEDAKAAGKVIQDMDLYTTWNPVFVPNGYKSIEEVRAIKREAYKRFYLRPSYFGKRITAIRSPHEFIRLARGFRFLLGLFGFGDKNL